MQPLYYHKQSINYYYTDRFIHDVCFFFFIIYIIHSTYLLKMNSVLKVIIFYHLCE